MVTHPSHGCGRQHARERAARPYRVAARRSAARRTRPPARPRHVGSAARRQDRSGARNAGARDAEALHQTRVSRRSSPACRANSTATIRGAIGRDPHNRLKYAIRADGKPAVTHYALRATFERRHRVDADARNRTHASDSRALRGARIPDFQRSDLRQARSALAAAGASAARVAAGVQASGDAKSTSRSKRRRRRRMRRRSTPWHDDRVHRPRRQRRRPARHAAARARRRRNAGLHAGRHGRYRQRHHAGRSARARRADHPREHLPSVVAARTRNAGRARRLAPVHGVGPPDPHRQRRVPSVQPGVAAQAR